tara:strand:+ start:132 stop:665 length:534 start_codon:yes stop_codon:yes gene_type:complete
MKTSILFSLLTLLISVSSFAQTDQTYYSKTINDIQFADYRVYKNTNIVDSLLNQYPNRTAVDFPDSSAASRDIKVVNTWREFRDSFIASINFDEFDFEKRKCSVFFTLHFDKDGQLKHVLFNWLNGLEFPEMTEHFVAFTYKYDFSGFPQGADWSQCGTIVLNRNDLKKAQTELASK